MKFKNKQNISKNKQNINKNKQNTNKNKKNTNKNKKNTNKNKKNTIKNKKNIENKKNTIDKKEKLLKIKGGSTIEVTEDDYDEIIETFIPFTMINYKFNSVEISIEELINGLVLLRLVNSKNWVQCEELCQSIDNFTISQIKIMNHPFPDTMNQTDIDTWNELGQDEWPFYYGMYIHKPQTLFLLLRGTRSELSIDWNYNMNYTLVEFLDGYVHQGFLDIFEQYIQPHLDTIIDNCRRTNTSNLIICGYSLGSAIAYITSYYISKTYPEAFTKVRILLYSLPPLANIQLNNLYQMSSLYALNTINIIFNNDPLPKLRLPARGLAKLHIPKNISVIIPGEEWFPWIRNPIKIIEYHKIKSFLPILKTLQQSIILETTTNGDIFNLYQLSNYHLLLDSIGHSHILYFPILTYRGQQTIYFVKNNTNQIVLFIDNTIVIIDKIEILADHIVRVFNPEYQPIITELNEKYSEPQLEEFQITFMLQRNRDKEYILKCSLSNFPIVLHLISILEIPDRTPFEFKTVQTHTTAIIYNKQANHTQNTNLPLLDINPNSLFISLQQHLILKPVSLIDDDDEFVMVESETLSQYLEPEYGVFVIMVEYRLSQGKLYYLIDDHYLEISNIYLDFIDNNIILNNDIVIPQDKVNILQLFDSLMELLMEDLLFPDPLYNCQNLILNYNQHSQLTYLPICLGENTFIGFNETKELFLVKNNNLQLITKPELLTKITQLPTDMIQILNKYW